MNGVMMASFCLCCTFIVSTSGFLSGCSARTGPSQSRISEMHSPTPSPTVELPPGNQAGQLRRSSVREVDFRNFTFPWPEDMIDPSSPERTFTMREGERPETRDKRGHVAGMGVSLSDPIYGDVTGDGVEEAILLFDVLSGGSAQANMVYVYAWRVGRPKLLWSFTTGDRADEGLRSVYAENGNLVVELYNPAQNRGTCCPIYFDRIHYKWKSGRFRREAKEEKLPNPDAIAPVVTRH